MTKSEFWKGNIALIAVIIIALMAPGCASTNTAKPTDLNVNKPTSAKAEPPAKTSPVMPAKSDVATAKPETTPEQKAALQKMLDEQKRIEAAKATAMAQQLPPIPSPKAADSAKVSTAKEEKKCDDKPVFSPKSEGTTENTKVTSMGDVIALPGSNVHIGDVKIDASEKTTVDASEKTRVDASDRSKTDVKVSDSKSSEDAEEDEAERPAKSETRSSDRDEIRKVVAVSRHEPTRGYVNGQRDWGGEACGDYRNVDAAEINIVTTTAKPADTEVIERPIRVTYIQSTGTYFYAWADGSFSNGLNGPRQGYKQMRTQTRSNQGRARGYREMPSATDAPWMKDNRVENR